MSELVRFGVAMERTLLFEFDRRIAARGYENRSEALRDLVRAELVRAAFQGDRVTVATLSVVHDAKLRSAVGAEVEKLRALVRSETAIPLQRGRTLVTLTLAGRASELEDARSRITTLRGVLVGPLATICEDDEGAGDREARKGTP